MRPLPWLGLVLSGLVATDADACIVGFDDPQALKKRADAVVVAELAQVAVRDVGQERGETYEYRLLPAARAGGEKPLKAMHAHYWNQRAFMLRDGELFCPRKSGSGLELDLQVGKTYRFYLRKSAHGLEVLYTEAFD